MENVCVVMELCSIMICLAALYNEKFKLDISTMSVIVVNMIIIYMINVGYLEQESVILTYVITFLYTLVEFGQGVKKAIINNILYVIIISMLQLACAILLVILQNIVNVEKLFIILNSILVLLVIFILRKQFVKLSELIYKKQVFSVTLMILCFIMIVAFFVNYHSNNIITIQSYLTSIVFAVLAVILTLKWNDSKAEIKEKQTELQMAAVYNGAFEELIVNIRKQQHDINNHLNAIFSQLYVYKNYEELVENQKRYYGELQKSFKYYDLLKIPIPILAGFLYSKCTQIFEKGVLVDTKIELSVSTMKMPLFEIITVLGIILDNATEAVLELDESEKRIKVEIIENEESILFSVKNKHEYLKAKQLENMLTFGYSSKGNGRGIGLYKAREILLNNNSILMLANDEIGGNNWVNFGFVLEK